MRKFIEKLREDKGFTLAELLIVVAIIAVLAAIAIPVFTTQLEKAREGTDLSNIRSAYAEAAMCVVNGTTTSPGNSAVASGAITPADTNSDGIIDKVTIAGFPISQTVAGWTIDTSNVGGYTGLADAWKPTKGTVAIVFTFGTDGKLTSIGV